MKYEHVLWVPEIFLGALLECTLWMVHLWMRLMLKEVNFLEGVTNSGEWAAVDAKRSWIFWRGHKAWRKSNSLAYETWRWIPKTPCRLKLKLNNLWSFLAVLAALLKQIFNCNLACSLKISAKTFSFPTSKTDNCQKSAQSKTEQNDKMSNRRPFAVSIVHCSLLNVSCCRLKLWPDKHDLISVNDEGARIGRWNSYQQMLVGDQLSKVPAAGVTHVCINFQKWNFFKRHPLPKTNQKRPLLRVSEKIS